MKFIKTIKSDYASSYISGGYINAHSICIFDIEKVYEDTFMVVARTDERNRAIATFSDKAEAQDYLDKLIAKLNRDGQVKSNQPLADKIADARILLDSAYVDARALGNDTLRDEKTLYYLDNAITAIDDLLNFIS